MFEDSVLALFENGHLDTSVIRGDGNTTLAKKGGDCIEFSGHKHMKGEKIVAFCNRHCNVLSPMVCAAGNRHESSLFPGALSFLKSIIKRIGSTVTDTIMILDTAYDSKINRKLIFNAGIVPNVKEKTRNRKKSKRGAKLLFDEEIYEERLRTIERVFAWEDKFKRTLIRFEHINLHHSGLKLIAYT